MPVKRLVKEYFTEMEQAFHTEPKFPHRIFVARFGANANGEDPLYIFECQRRIIDKEKRRITQ